MKPKPSVRFNVVVGASECDCVYGGCEKLSKTVKYVIWFIPELASELFSAFNIFLL